MRYRKALFIVVYAKSKKDIRYLILRRRLHWKGWEFPKGGVEQGESALEALHRELREETGHQPLKVRRFPVKGRYTYKKKYQDRPGVIGQTYTLYAAEIKKGKVKIDKKEHSSYAWLSAEKALEKLTWPNQRKCLRIVDRWLKKRI